MGPNPGYFDDPIQDAMMKMMLELAAQVWINRDRMMAVEDLLEQQGTVGREAIDAYQPSADRAAAIKLERDRFINDIFKEVQKIRT